MRFARLPALATWTALLAFMALAALPNAQVQAQEQERGASPIARIDEGGRALSGQELFQAKCAACHEAGGWGTRALSRRVPADQAQLTARRTVPAAYVTMVVREGVGSMPPLTPTDLSDAELVRIAQWLEARK